MPSAGTGLAIPELRQCPRCSKDFTVHPEFSMEHLCGDRLPDFRPAFKCSLCPRRFTRAFNLRSHLLTHTDERPFICTVCGKAFARNNDRKSHEFLHLGQKKFVCKGDLANGNQWGCGRRFSRKRNFQRHFFGRCGQPLRDQESSQQQSALLAASALTGLGNSSSASEQDRQQPPEQNQPCQVPQLSIDLPQNSWTSNEGEQVSGPGPTPPQLFPPPTRAEALRAADTVRQYISRQGRLITEENGSQGYLDLTFQPFFSFPEFTSRN